MEGEDHRGYEELLHRVTAALQPMDIMEEMWIYDIVGLAWDTFRWRRVKAHELTQAAGRQIRELIKPFVVGDAQQVSEQWALGNEAAAERVNAALAAAGLSTRSVVTRKLDLTAYDLEKIVRIEHVLANAEARRSAAVREVERYRANFGARLRRAVEIEDETNMKALAHPLRTMGRQDDQSAQASYQSAQRSCQHGPANGRRQSALGPKCAPAWLEPSGLV